MSSSLNFSEDLKTVKSKNYRLIFFIGLPGCNKESQIEKISQEYKYSSINIDSLISQEISSSSEKGNQLNEYKSRGSAIPSELLVSLLVDKIKTIKNKNILIDGFPKTLNDALYFEQNIQPIELIIKFNTKEETCIQNLISCGNNENDFKNNFEQINKDIKSIDDFYSPFSIVREVNTADKTIGEINILIKQCLYPTIYSIIGKRYSGKTELGKILEKRMGIKLIDFNDFLNTKDIKKNINDNKYIMDKFIELLRSLRDIRILIEDFPQNKEQYSFFVNNCKTFEKIIFLNADNSSCLQRLNKIPLDHPNYIPSSALNKLLYEFEKKKIFLNF